ncbi:MAG TPA: YbaN family protein [Pyrinomonadaceae bacterium]|jgi:hypothetical protein|nr:YbaN family protein [Pyrinomonadaceae bacterium]
MGVRRGTNPALKVLLNVAGTVSLGLGILGVFLPLLPATPFLLLASACYLRGSERLHRKLMESRVLGSYIRNFQRGRGIPLRAKVGTIALLWASLLFSIYSVDILAVDVMLCLCGATSSFLILRMKTLKEGD